MLRLGAFIFAGLAVGILIVGSLDRLWPGLSRTEKDFLTFAVGAVTFQGAALVWIHFFLREHQVGWREGFGLNRSRPARVLGLVLLTTLLALPAAFALGAVSAQVLKWLRVEPQLQFAVRMLREPLSPWQIVLHGTQSVVLAPVAEEALFRGILYPALKRHTRPWIALWSTSLMFGLVHGEWIAMVPMVFLAVVLTWLYEKTDNLLAPVLAHMVFNGVNFTLLVASPSWLKLE